MSRPTLRPPAVPAGGINFVAGTNTDRAPVDASYLTISDPAPPLAASTMAYAVPSGSHRAGPNRGAVYSRVLKILSICARSELTGLAWRASSVTTTAARERAARPVTWRMVVLIAEGL